MPKLSPHARAVAALLALAPDPVVSPDIVTAVRNEQPMAVDVNGPIDQMRDEADQVAQARGALLDLPSAAPLAGELL